MEYGASAEDIARVCHAHPVSTLRIQLLTHTHTHTHTCQCCTIWNCIFTSCMYVISSSSHRPFSQTNAEALREASLMAYCGKAINY